MRRVTSTGEWQIGDPPHLRVSEVVSFDPKQNPKLIGRRGRGGWECERNVDRGQQAHGFRPTPLFQVSKMAHSMQLIGEDGVMAQADARAFAILMAPNRTARRLQAADRTIAGAINRVATMRRRREAGAEKAYAIADRALQRELAESIAPGWGRTFRVKMQSPPFRSASDRKISRSKMSPPLPADSG